MKVECIKTSIDYPDRSIMNCDIEGYLSVGNIFWVYGMRFSKNVTYFYIFHGEHLLEIPSELFKIVDDGVPREWKIKIRSNNEITLWPYLFYEEGFLENFAEMEKKRKTDV